MIFPRFGCSGGRTVSGPGRPGGVRHIDLDLVLANPFYGGNRSAGRTDQSGGILGGKQEGERDTSFVGHRQISDHPGGEQVVLQAGILNARQCGGNPGLEGVAHRLDGLDVLHFGHHLAEPRLDALLQSHGRGRTAVAGASESQQQNAVLLVKVHDLDAPAMRRDIGPKGVERSFNAIDGVHG
jgi:hypothetical protein